MKAVGSLFKLSRYSANLRSFDVERMVGNLANVNGNFAVFLFLVVIVVTVDGKEGAVLGPDRWKEESCIMVVKKCTSMYTRIINGNTSNPASDAHVCFMLQAYKLCLMRNASSCAVDKAYDTLTTVISRLLYGLCSESNNSSGHWETSTTGKLRRAPEEGGVLDEG